MCAKIDFSRPKGNKPKELDFNVFTLIFIFLLFMAIVCFLAIWWLVLALGVLFVAAVGFVARRKRRLKLDRTFLFFSILGFLIVFFIALPIANMISYVNLETLEEALGDPGTLRTIGLSMLAALYATSVALLLGIPLAFVMARKNFWGKSFLASLVDIPIVIPHTVAGIALLMVFGSHGLLGGPFQQLSITFVDALPGIVVAMLFVSAPFVINSVREGFEDVDPRLENVAMSLGASRAKSFFTVTLPLAGRSILVGATMCWARAISEFGAVVVIAYYPMVASTYIYSTFYGSGIEHSRPIAVVLLLLCLVVFLTLRAISNSWKKYDKA